MGQASCKSAWSSGCWLCADSRTRDRLIVIRLPFFRFLLSDWFGGLLGPRAILRERLARQNYVVFPRIHGSRWSRGAISGWPAIVVTTGIAVSLRRGIFRRRKVSPALMATISPSTTTRATTTTSPAPAASASSTVTASIPSTVAALAPTILARSAVTPNAWRIVAGRVVAGAKVLRCGSVRFRLTLFELRRLLTVGGGFSMTTFVAFRFVFRVVRFFACVALRTVRFIEVQNFFVTA